MRLVVRCSGVRWLARCVPSLAAYVDRLLHKPCRQNYIPQTCVYPLESRRYLCVRSPECLLALLYALWIGCSFAFRRTGCSLSVAIRGDLFTSSITSIHLDKLCLPVLFYSKITNWFLLWARVTMYHSIQNLDNLIYRSTVLWFLVALRCETFVYHQTW